MSFWDLHHKQVVYGTIRLGLVAFWSTVGMGACALWRAVCS